MAERSSVREWTGPTVWMTQREDIRPAVVATAWPAGRPCGSSVARSLRQAARISGPPARWMAPSTPPPPSSEEFAALTTAWTSCSVMSPVTTRSSMAPILRARVARRASSGGEQGGEGAEECQVRDTVPGAQAAGGDGGAAHRGGGGEQRQVGR